jgi:hypothetical protein
VRGRYRPVVGTYASSKQVAAAVWDSSHGTRAGSGRRAGLPRRGKIYSDTQQWQSDYEKFSLVPFTCHSFQSNIWHKARQF